MLASTSRTFCHLAKPSMVQKKVASSSSGSHWTMQTLRPHPDQNPHFNMIPRGRELKLEMPSASEHLHRLPALPYLGPVPLDTQTRSVLGSRQVSGRHRDRGRQEGARAQRRRNLWTLAHPSAQGPRQVSTSLPRPAGCPSRSVYQPVNKKKVVLT